MLNIVLEVLRSKSQRQSTFSLNTRDHVAVLIKAVAHEIYTYISMFFIYIYKLTYIFAIIKILGIFVSSKLYPVGGGNATGRDCLILPLPPNKGRLLSFNIYSIQKIFCIVGLCLNRTLPQSTSAVEVEYYLLLIGHRQIRLIELKWTKMNIIYLSYNIIQ